MMIPDRELNIEKKRAIKLYRTDRKGLYCGCPSWKYQKCPINERSCKHIRLFIEEEKKKILPKTVKKEVVNEVTKKLSKRGSKKVSKMVPITVRRFADMPKLMYGTTFGESESVVEGWWWSVKLDGVRGLWDGFRRQMFTRQGIKIDLPARISNVLPCKMILDGELYSKIKNRSAISSAVQSTSDHSSWSGIWFYVFDLHAEPNVSFRDRYETIKASVSSLYICEQREIGRKVSGWDIAHCEIDKGQEGIVCRDPSAGYLPGRRRGVLVKLKRWLLGYAKKLSEENGNLYEELETKVHFRMTTVKTAVKKGDIVKFRFCGRTSQRHLPEFPVFVCIHQKLTRK